jgi:hypothetical protein
MQQVSAIILAYTRITEACSCASLNEDDRVAAVQTCTKDVYAVTAMLEGSSLWRRRIRASFQDGGERCCGVAPKSEFSFKIVPLIVN